MKKAISLILAVLLLLPVWAYADDAAQDAGLPFKDVEAGTWYTDAVAYVYGRNLMTGTDEATFSPDLPLTRAQLVTVLWRLAGQPAADGAMPYSDVEADAWYAGAARWAAAEQIADQSGSFAPDKVLSREETALLLWKYAKAVGADVSVGEDTNILSYDDAFDITEGYAAAMQWAVGAGIINGISATQLSPRGVTDRAAAAQIFKNFVEFCEM